MTAPQSRTWADMIEANPNHSVAYIERFKTMASEGRDLHGEARFVDAMVERGANILDAGCGPGRVGGHLASLGHNVVGVDFDPVLIDEARTVHPRATWLVGDLSRLELSSEALSEAGVPSRFDVVISAGNVLPFVDEGRRRGAVERLAGHLNNAGRLVVGFGLDRGYAADDFLADAAHAGLSVDVKLSTWDLRPFEGDSDFLVAVLSA